MICSFETKRLLHLVLIKQIVHKLMYIHITILHVFKPEKYRVPFYFHNEDHPQEQHCYTDHFHQFSCTTV